MPPRHVPPELVDVDQPMPAAPPSTKRPTWNVATAVGRLAEIWVLPYEKADQAILANLRKLLGGVEVA